MKENAVRKKCIKSHKCQCTRCTALTEVINAFGGQKAFGEKMKVAQASVSRWYKIGFPPKRIPQVVKIVPDKNLPVKLCPELYALNN